MRCKIIEIGPQSAFYGDTENYNRPGKLERLYGGAPNGWLVGRFSFDEPNPHKAIFVFQMKVQPLEPWGD